MRKDEQQDDQGCALPAVGSENCRRVELQALLEQGGASAAMLVSVWARCLYCARERSGGVTDPLRAAVAVATATHTRLGRARTLATCVHHTYSLTASSLSDDIRTLQVC